MYLAISPSCTAALRAVTLSLVSATFLVIGAVTFLTTSLADLAVCTGDDTTSNALLEAAPIVAALATLATSTSSNLDKFSSTAVW